MTEKEIDRFIEDLYEARDNEIKRPTLCGYPVVFSDKVPTQPARTYILKDFSAWTIAISPEDCYHIMQQIAAMQDETGERDRKEAEFRRAAERSVIPIEELRRIAFENGVHPSFTVQMSDETGEREDAITVDEQGCVVNTDWRSEPSKDEQRAAREREIYEAWRKKAEGKR